MEWFLNVPELANPGTLKELFDAINGATYYPLGTRTWTFGASMLGWRVGIRGGTRSATDGFFVKVYEYLWGDTAVSADIVSQLSINISGAVVLS